MKADKKLFKESKKVKQRYATRKLKVGMVSLLMGFTFVFGGVSNDQSIQLLQAASAASVEEAVQNKVDFELAVPLDGEKEINFLLPENAGKDDEVSIFINDKEYKYTVTGEENEIDLANANGEITKVKSASITLDNEIKDGTKVFATFKDSEGNVKFEKSAVAIKAETSAIAKNIKQNGYEVVADVEAEDGVQAELQSVADGKTIAKCEVAGGKATFTVPKMENVEKLNVKAVVRENGKFQSESDEIELDLRVLKPAKVVPPLEGSNLIYVKLPENAKKGDKITVTIGDESHIYTVEGNEIGQKICMTKFEHKIKKGQKVKTVASNQGGIKSEESVSNIREEIESRAAVGIKQSGVKVTAETNAEAGSKVELRDADNTLISETVVEKDGKINFDISEKLGIGVVEAKVVVKEEGRNAKESRKITLDARVIDEVKIVQPKDGQNILRIALPSNAIKGDVITVKHKDVTKTFTVERNVSNKAKSQMSEMIMFDKPFEENEEFTAVAKSAAGLTSKETSVKVKEKEKSAVAENIKQNGLKVTATTKAPEHTRVQLRTAEGKVLAETQVREGGKINLDISKVEAAEEFDTKLVVMEGNKKAAESENIKVDTRKMNLVKVKTPTEGEKAVRITLPENAKKGDVVTITVGEEKQEIVLSGNESTNSKGEKNVTAIFNNVFKNGTEINAVMKNQVGTTGQAVTAKVAEMEESAKATDLKQDGLKITAKTEAPQFTAVELRSLGGDLLGRGKVEDGGNITINLPGISGVSKLSVKIVVREDGKKASESKSIDVDARKMNPVKIKTPTEGEKSVRVKLPINTKKGDVVVVKVGEEKQEIVLSGHEPTNSKGEKNVTAIFNNVFKKGTEINAVIKNPAGTVSQAATAKVAEMEESAKATDLKQDGLKITAKTEAPQFTAVELRSLGDNLLARGKVEDGGNITLNLPEISGVSKLSVKIVVREDGKKASESKSIDVDARKMNPVKIKTPTEGEKSVRVTLPINTKKGDVVVVKVGEEKQEIVLSGHEPTNSQGEKNVTAIFNNVFKKGTEINAVIKNPARTVSQAATAKVAEMEESAKATDLKQDGLKITAKTEAPQFTAVELRSLGGDLLGRGKVEDGGNITINLPGISGVSKLSVKIVVREDGKKASESKSIDVDARKMNPVKVNTPTEGEKSVRVTLPINTKKGDVVVVKVGEEKQEIVLSGHESTNSKGEKNIAVVFNNAFKKDAEVKAVIKNPAGTTSKETSVKVNEMEKASAIKSFKQVGDKLIIETEGSSNTTVEIQDENGKVIATGRAGEDGKVVIDINDLNNTHKKPEIKRALMFAVTNIKRSEKTEAKNEEAKIGELKVKAVVKEEGKSSVESDYITVDVRKIGKVGLEAPTEEQNSVTISLPENAKKGDKITVYAGEEKGEYTVTGDEPANSKGERRVTLVFNHEFESNIEIKAIAESPAGIKSEENSVKVKEMEKSAKATDLKQEGLKVKGKTAADKSTKVELQNKEGKVLATGEVGDNGEFVLEIPEIKEITELNVKVVVKEEGKKAADSEPIVLDLRCMQPVKVRTPEAGEKVVSVTLPENAKKGDIVTVAVGDEIQELVVSGNEQPNSKGDRKVAVVFNDEFKKDAELKATIKNQAGIVSDEVAVKVSGEEKETGGSSSSGGSSSHRSSSSSSSSSTVKSPARRISGSNRVATGVEVSKDIYASGAKTVILANSDKFSDVLTATPYGKTIKAPILYTNLDNIPKETLNELKRLGAEKVILIGGEKTISAAQQKDIESKGYKTERISGKDRYETSKIIAEKMKAAGAKGMNNAVIASGETFPDALSIAPFAVHNETPILLVQKNRISDHTLKEIEGLKAERIYISGGESTVSKDVEGKLKAYSKNGVKRFAGSDRYETSVAITKELMPNAKKSVFASGEIFPDALLAGELAGHYNVPLLLQKKNTVPASVEKYIEKSGIKENIIVGGVNTISDSVVEAIKKAENK